jgi:hypothetical protein
MRVVEVLNDCLPILAHVVHALDADGRIARPRYRGEKEADKDRNDSDDHQELNQRKAEGS